MKKKYIHFQAKASKTVEGRIEGWANVSEKNGVPEIDRDGEVIAVNALGLNPGESVTVPCLLQHDWNLPIGKGTVYNKTADGITGMWVEMDLAIHSESNTLRERAMEAYELVKQGITPTFSIGFIIKEYGPMGEYQGQRYTVISSIELLEVSVVTVPSNRSAQAMEVRSAGDPAAVPAEQPNEEEAARLLAVAIEELRQAFNELYAVSVERMQAAIESAIQTGPGQLRYQALQRLAPKKGGFMGLDMAKVCADPMLKQYFRDIVDLMIDKKVRLRLYHDFGLYTEKEKAVINQLKKSS